jgi:hypothetical protein
MAPARTASRPAACCPTAAPPGQTRPGHPPNPRRPTGWFPRRLSRPHQRLWLDHPTYATGHHGLPLDGHAGQRGTVIPVAQTVPPIWGQGAQPSAQCRGVQVAGKRHEDTLIWRQTLTCLLAGQSLVRRRFEPTRPSASAAGPTLSKAVASTERPRSRCHGAVTHHDNCPQPPTTWLTMLRSRPLGSTSGSCSRSLERLWFVNPRSEHYPGSSGSAAGLIRLVAVMHWGAEPDELTESPPQTGTGWCSGRPAPRPAPWTGRHAGRCRTASRLARRR